MPGNVHVKNGRSGKRIRTAVWMAAAVLWLVPWIAMQFTDEVNWDATDFVVFGALLIGACVTYELATRVAADSAYRIGAGLALATALLLFWVNGAVGIVGSENLDINMAYFVVLALGVVGSAIVRARPRGLSIVLYGMTSAQVLIAVVAIVAGLGKSVDTEWPKDIVVLTVVFSALWMAAATMFRKAGRELGSHIVGNPGGSEREDGGRYADGRACPGESGKQGLITFSSHCRISYI